jgi:hypothetical protein
MVCEIARGLDPQQLDEIKGLEDETGLTVVAFACRSLDPTREERLKAIQAEMGPVLTVEPARPSDGQLARIRALERALGVSLVAVRLDDAAEAR